jgi:cytochrome c biogenesis protein CcmG, thiol:disulfide interchange protein DsbE
MKARSPCYGIKTCIDFGVYGVPETYVVDGSGRIRYRHVGPLTAEDVKQKILPVIERISATGGSPSVSGRSG